MSDPYILIVDDEEDIREMLSLNLEMAGYRTRQACDAQEALALLHEECPSLIVLDWMMPKTSGLELARRLKADEAFAELPIIMLSAKGEEDNKIQGLEVGADDYMTKPFSPRELIARIKALLRRAQPSTESALMSVRGLQLDTLAQRVTIDGAKVDIGPTEYRLLSFFMQNRERAYSREHVLDRVWGNNVYVEERTVDVHIRRLRKALGPDYDGLIQTVRGTGYRFSTQ